VPQFEDPRTRAAVRWTEHDGRTTTVRLKADTTYKRNALAHRAPSICSVISVSSVVKLVQPLKGPDP